MDLTITISADKTGAITTKIEPATASGVEVYGLMKMTELIMRADILTQLRTTTTIVEEKSE